MLMDNLSVHTSGWVRELIEQRGCQLWLLPSYSPEMNPIEEAFSKAPKALLRKAKARTLEAAVRGHGMGARGGKHPRCSRLLRASRL